MVCELDRSRRGGETAVLVSNALRSLSISKKEREKEKDDATNLPFFLISSEYCLFPFNLFPRGQ